METGKPLYAVYETDEPDVLCPDQYMLLGL